MRKHPMLNLPCSACGAEPGKPCNGRPLGEVCGARVTAWADTPPTGPLPPPPSALPGEGPSSGRGRGKVPESESAPALGAQGALREACSHGETGYCARCHEGWYP